MVLRRCLQLFGVLVCLSTLGVVVPSDGQTLSNEPNLTEE